MPRARYTLRTDISEFYASIYTHSIEWALGGKAVAKARVRARGPKVLGSLLDDAVRAGQDGQTKGIPIGPDTSLLISELILCQLDVELADRFPQAAGSSLRFLDDFEFFARTRGEAEEVLRTWDALLSTFDLSLNPKKTEIIEGPTPPELPWRSRLSRFEVRTDTELVLTNDLVTLFSLALEEARNNPGDAVLKYTINRVHPRPVGPRSWPLFAQLLLTAATTEPSTLSAVSSALNWAVSTGLPIDLPLVESTLNDLCVHHGPLEHGSEVAWSLAILSDLGLSLTSESAAVVAGMQDNCCLLYLLHLDSASRVTGNRPNLSLLREGWDR